MMGIPKDHKRLRDHVRKVGRAARAVFFVAAVRAYHAARGTGTMVRYFIGPVGYIKT